MQHLFLLHYYAISTHFTEFKISEAYVGCRYLSFYAKSLKFYSCAVYSLNLSNKISTVAVVSL